ncbi:ATP-binding protein [Streptomyces mirabilis]|nr:ATP-binding protein [Streptomyces mirabilis]
MGGARRRRVRGPRGHPDRRRGRRPGRHVRAGTHRRPAPQRAVPRPTCAPSSRACAGAEPSTPKPRQRPKPDADEFELLAADLSRAHDGAVTAVVQAAQLSSQAGSEQKVEVFVNLARRLQSLVHREISILDELENEIEDPDLLKGLFHVDHLATRIRRHAENLAVLGGAVSRRQWSNPVSMTEVLRSAIAEVEQYSRVKLVPPIDGTLRGHAVADVIHLLAELVENATVFSAPHTQVLLRVNLVTSGLAVEVEDRGLGMPLGEQNKMNALLTDPDQVNVASLLQDGRIGLFVVSQLARRHGIHVRLQTNIYGGVQAVLVVPQALLGAPPGAIGDVSQAQSQQSQQSQTQQLKAGGPRPPAGPQAGRPRPCRPAARRWPPCRDRDSGTRCGPPRPARAAAASAAPRARRPRGAAQPGRGPARHPARRPARGRGERGHAAHPRNGAVRGTMGKPQLPKRRAQEHIAPQLRDGPLPRQDPEQVVGHDPGLMAAFQRGIGLAEAQHAEERRTEAPHSGAAHLERPHPDLPHSDLLHPDPLHRDPPHPDPRHLAPLPPLDAMRVDRTSTGGAPRISETHTAHAPAQHEAHGTRDNAPAPGHDHTARHDGSTTAG